MKLPPSWLDALEEGNELVRRYLEEGKETFRFDTFGSEDLGVASLSSMRRSLARRWAA